MARGGIRRFRYLVLSVVALASVWVAGAANWPKV